MGEGCGTVILDNKNKNKNDFYICGGSNTCDTFNVTTHDLSGDEIERVILEAIENSNLKLSDIDAIKAHATGSENNDETESKGMIKAFGDQIPPVTGIKPFIGHTLGASGVIELVIITESIKNGFFPVTPGFKEFDEKLQITPVTESYNISEGCIMMNYFGFGGNCTSFIVSNRD